MCFLKHFFVWEGSYVIFLSFRFIARPYVYIYKINLGIKFKARKLLKFVRKSHNSIYLFQTILNLHQHRA